MVKIQFDNEVWATNWRKKNAIKISGNRYLWRGSSLLYTWHHFYSGLSDYVSLNIEFDYWIQQQFTCGWLEIFFCFSIFETAFNPNFQNPLRFFSSFSIDARILFRFNGARFARRFYCSSDFLFAHSQLWKTKWSTKTVRRRLIHHKSPTEMKSKPK